MNYSDRIAHYSPNLGEALGGSLPSIDALKQGINDRVTGFTDINQKVDGIISSASQFKKRANLDYRLYEDGMENPKRDVLSVMFLDSLTFMANLHKIRSQAQEMKKRSGSVNGRELDLEDMAEARFQILASLGEFGRVYSGAPDELKFKAAEAVFYEALCLIYDRSDINGSEDNTRHEFIGLLGENKILSNLKHGKWPGAYYGSLHDDHYFESDIVIPMGPTWNLDRLYIQVKSSTGSEASFSVEKMPERYNHLLVKVPLGGESGWFELPKGQLADLETAIESYRPTTLSR